MVVLGEEQRGRATARILTYVPAVSEERIRVT